MAGFLYYFPGNTTIARPDDAPAECGLSHLVGASCSFGTVENKGPDGKFGRILAIHPDSKDGKAARCGFYPDVQDWSPVMYMLDDKSTVSHWIGFEKENRPRPEDLERKEKLSGFLVPMAGQQWEIVCVHAPIHSLPTRFTRKPAGWREEVVPEYAKLVDEAARFRNAWHSPQLDENGLAVFPSNEEICSFVCQMLAVNYRVGEWECGILGLADSRNWTPTLRVAWGLASLEAEEAAKKKDTTPTNS